MNKTTGSAAMQDFWIMLCALTANLKPAFINQMRFAVAALALLSLSVFAWYSHHRDG